MLAKGNRSQPSITPSNTQASRIGLPPIERSTFFRPVTHTTTIDAGYLYPLYLEECLPGDVFQANIDIFVRMMTLLRPIMSNLHIDLFAFYCPNRILWNHWQQLQGQQDRPGQPTDYLLPHIYGTSNSWAAASGTIYDYLGLPVNAGFYSSGVSATRHIQALPLRMYNRIITDWFRDQDYQDPPEIHDGDGPDDYQDYALVRRNKRQDYFTTARPWPQKGPAVQIPVGSSSAPVVGNSGTLNLVRGATPGQGAIRVGVQTNSQNLQIGDGATLDPAGSSFSPFTGASANRTVGVHQSPLYSGLIADLSSAYATSVNVIRDAVVLQQMLELDARGGTRYIESLFTRWRVVVQDDRLQRPEYIGGFSQRLDISAVPQTSASGENQPMAQLGGYGTGGRDGHRLSYSVPEHGHIMILVNIRADLTYSQQLRRLWTRRSRWDFPEPLTMHIGEQPILSSEMVYDAPGDPVTNMPWGYQEAWAEYRYSQNLVTGLMRPGVSGSLAAWNLALPSDDVPFQLDGEWLKDDPPIGRVIAVPSEPAFLVDMTVNARWHRAMPVYSTPGLDIF